MTASFAIVNNNYSFLRSLTALAHAGLDGVLRGLRSGIYGSNHMQLRVNPLAIQNCKVLAIYSYYPDLREEDLNTKSHYSITVTSESSTSKIFLSPKL